MVRFMKRKHHVRWPNLSFAISDHLEVSARPNTSVEPDTEAASPYNDRHRQQSRRNAKQNRKSLRGKSQTCVFQSFLFPSRGTPRVEKHHAPTAAIKGVGFRKTRLLSANLERSGVVVTIKATTISGALRVHHNLILILACPEL
jgi:hypothetical protein